MPPKYVCFLLENHYVHLSHNVIHTNWVLPGLILVLWRGLHPYPILWVKLFWSLFSFVYIFFYSWLLIYLFFSVNFEFFLDTFFAHALPPEFPLITVWHALVIVEFTHWGLVDWLPGSHLEQRPHTTLSWYSNWCIISWYFETPFSKQSVQMSFIMPSHYLNSKTQKIFHMKMSFH